MFDINILPIILAVVAIIVATICEDPQPQCISILTGQLYYDELMSPNCNPNTFLTCARMSKPTFERLLELLKNEGQLQDSLKISAGEKLMTFMYVLTGFSMRQIGHRWQHSTSTLRKNINDVIRAIIICKPLLMQAVTVDEPVHERIAGDPKYQPYFGNCLGAFDGTHIHAIVSPLEAALFRNRKKFISQNVLGVIRFDMTWSYVLAGWEGCAHDGKVLEDALEKGLPTFPGFYYLGDAGYALTWFCLTPYRGVRYHLREWAAGNRRPQTREELFNLRHASLRNVVERGYGTIKKRFPILEKMNPYPFRKQVDIVNVAFMINNFIRKNNLTEDDYDNAEEQNEEDDEPRGPINEAIGQNANLLNAWRDDIAQRMWEDYQQYVIENNL